MHINHSIKIIMFILFQIKWLNLIKKNLDAQKVVVVFFKKILKFYILYLKLKSYSIIIKWVVKEYDTNL